MSDDTSVEAPDITEQADEILTVDDEYYTTDNVALVTGAASGIGRATAITAAANGLTAVATDMDEDGLDDTAAKAEEIGVEGTIQPVVGDLTDDDDIEGIVGEAASHGSIKYLANIAGTQHIDPIEEFPMDQYDMMQQSMLRAALYLSKLCIPHIRDSEDGVGAIGNMSSVHGHYVTADKVAYNIMKFGLRGLSQSIAAEGDGDLRSFSISVPYVKTPMVTGQIADTAEQRGITEEEVVEEVMLGEARVSELMDPVEVANLFIYGWSGHGRFLDGGDLLWDGGYSLTYE